MIEHILAECRLEVLAVELEHARVGGVQVHGVHVGWDDLEGLGEGLKDLGKLGRIPSRLRATEWWSDEELKKEKEKASMF